MDSSGLLQARIAPIVVAVRVDRADSIAPVVPHRDRTSGVEPIADRRICDARILTIADLEPTVSVLQTGCDDGSGFDARRANSGAGRIGGAASLSSP